MRNRMLVWGVLALMAGPWVAAARCETVGERLAEMPPENVARTLAILELAGVLPTEPIVRESATLYADAFQLVLQMKTRKLIVSRAGEALGLLAPNDFAYCDETDEVTGCLDLSAEAGQEAAKRVEAALGLQDSGRQMTALGLENYSCGALRRPYVDVRQTTIMHGIKVPTGFEVRIDGCSGALLSFSHKRPKLQDASVPLITEADARRLALEQVAKEGYWFYTVKQVEKEGIILGPYPVVSGIPLHTCVDPVSTLAFRGGVEAWRKTCVGTIVYRVEVEPRFFDDGPNNRGPLWIDAFTGYIY